MRFTWRQVTADPERVVAALRRRLAADAPYERVASV